MSLMSVFPDVPNPYGPFDSGDPSTTNLYLGNLSPKVSWMNLYLGNLSPMLRWPVVTGLHSSTGCTPKNHTLLRNQSSLVFCCSLLGRCIILWLNIFFLSQLKSKLFRYQSIFYQIMCIRWQLYSLIPVHQLDDFFSICLANTLLPFHGFPNRV